ncbi:protein kinase domain-containing protein [Tundrisphaera lichenicola]|uniref:protein kinase domain-containing protein n=1 Tax=Tundrisphaera lichenicola TaxID=2029860 RepID=UPI003EB69B29
MPDHDSLDAATDLSRPPPSTDDATDPDATNQGPASDSFGTQAPPSYLETRPEPDLADGPPDPLFSTRFVVDSYATATPKSVVHLAWRTKEIPGYELIEPLGQGGMGEVWKARQIRLNRVVAIKMVLGGDRVGFKELIRFLAEAEIVASIKHSHVVQVHEYGDAAGRPFLAMEYLPGGSLTDRLRSSGRFDPIDAARLVGTLAEAVQAAHDQGIVHRDLKPSNVLFDEFDQPKVTDFGLAKRSGSGDLTEPEAVMGTPAYMSPEQARGGTKFVGPQADVYSLGVILYECLAGDRPFDDTSRMALRRKVIEEEPLRPGRKVPGLPRDLELICLKCLEKEPVERYATAGALAADLGRFAAGEPVSVRTAGLVERSARWARRKPTLAAAYTLGLLALLLGGLGGLAVWQWRAAERARAAAIISQGQAEASRVEADRQRERFERSEYGRTIEVAHQEWREDNVVGTLALLQSTRGDLRGWEWDYLQGLCHSEIFTIKGHAGPVPSVAYSPDGSRILTGSDDGTARLWDATTGAEVLTIKAHAGPVGSAVFSPDGSRILTGGADKTARIWDSRTGVEVRAIQGPDIKIFSVAFSPDGSRILIGGDGGTVKVWDAQTGGEILALKGQAGPTASVIFSPDGSRILTASGEGSARVWDAKTGVEVLALKGHVSSVFSARFSPDGTRVVTGSREKSVKVWDVRTGAEALMLKGHTDWVLSAVFSPDGARVVTTSLDRMAKVWDVKTGAEIVELKGHAGPVFSAEFSPDGSRILTGSRDGTARVWDVKTGVEVLMLKGHTDWVRSVRFSPNGSRILSGSGDGTARLWDARTAVEVLTLKGHAGIVLSVGFSPDGARLITGGSDGTARVWDARTGVEVLSLKGHVGSVESAIILPDGLRILTGSGDGTARVWDAKTGAEVLTLKGHVGTVFSAEFSPDGSRILTAGEDKTARLWDARTGAEVLMLKGHGAVVRAARFNPDGSRVVTSGADGTARIWEALPVHRESQPGRPIPEQGP